MLLTQRKIALLYRSSLPRWRGLFVLTLFGLVVQRKSSRVLGLEKYVMTKLFTRAFASLPEDVKRDEQLSEKMSLVQQFIHPENLDIKPSFQNESSWLLAQKELQKINMYKAPRDKLVCILNCCKVINNLLLNASIASNNNPPGADEFLPVLIYVTIKANPPQFHSNLLYIQRYRRQSRLVSEAAYFFTNILSAESFIWNIDAQSLSMDDAEFENNMKSARALLSGLSADPGTLPNQSGHDSRFLSKPEPREPKLQSSKAKKERNSSLPAMGLHPPLPQAPPKATESHSIPKRPSISDLEKKGAAHLLEEEDVGGSLREFPFLYASVGDLTVDDVEGLLNSYKQLVLKYVSLSKGLGRSTPTIQVPVADAESNNTTESVEATAVQIGNEKTVVMSTEDGSDGGPFVETYTSESNLPPREQDKHSDGEKDEAYP
ncbi:vacuolar protein sorting-associated protein 9A-like isoform X2 [Magnolia sinica]|uniref:vacuolar protein sorting-associated protein 9A-like isoform X2 n=1 Tax=Magnolia sinica TaxID=86752 RepID=UPI00265B61E9|nr:vacuolar protein sorting-associated protein 9A-like isoform X2 [Magnolia sinica]